MPAGDIDLDQFTRGREKAAHVARRFLHPAKPLFLRMNYHAIGYKRRARRPTGMAAPRARGLLVR